jgi:nucleotide-binding universal stress UspA family protein
MPARSAGLSQRSTHRPVASRRSASHSTRPASATPPVHVVHPMRSVHQAADEQHVLAGALIRVQADYPAVKVTSFIQVGSLAKVLVSACTSRDLLVLGHHRRGPFTPHTLEADVIDALHAAPCPVAVVHEPSEATVTASADVLASAHKVGQLGAAPASRSYAPDVGPRA